jgi:hypothetical protein
MSLDGDELASNAEDVGITKEYLSMPLFEEGSARLDPRDNFSGLMLRWDRLTNHVVRIIGYAEVEREDEQVARLRAEAVHHFLLERGIAPERFDAVSWRVHGPPSEEKLRPYHRRASVLAYNAKLGPDEWRHYFERLHHVHDMLRLGCSEDHVYNVILRELKRRMLPNKQPPEVELDAGDSLIQGAIDHPFDILRGAVLCALLSKERTLKDLWLQEDSRGIEDSLGILPLKRGVYDWRLGTIKSGATVEQLHALLGVRVPKSYYRDHQGKRVIHFRYYGFGRDYWDYTLDAGGGIVTSVNLGAG